ncbi:MAG: penicillin-binding protein 2 [Candidatus Margulisiibacteriota bacterium]|jgi:cell division protein FtsI/penicillin-binding protein 2
MKIKQKKIRIIVYFLIFFLFAGIIITRLFYLQIINHDFFVNKLERQLKRVINISPHRGNIYSRDKKPLALTDYAYSLYAIPVQIKNKSLFASKIAPLINKSKSEVFNKIKHRSYFIWLKRKCSQNIYKKINALNLEGLGFIKEEKRVYPYKNLTSEIVGFVGIDNQGLGGIEYEFDKFLTGKPGKIILENDPRGYQIISGLKEIIDPTYDGGNIYTTIDFYLQYIAKKYIKEGVEKNKASRGSVIILNPNTGEVLAMANYPDFDPNNWRKTKSAYLRNSAINDLFEPGSIFKIVIISSILEKKIATPDTFFTIPTSLKIGKYTINEAHKLGKGSYQKTVSQILIESLNVGTSVLSQKVGKDTFYNYIKKFGFGEYSGIDLPGEAKGILRTKEHTANIDLMMMSFGQSISVTPLQMTLSFSVVANGGYLLKPRIIQSFTDQYGYLKSIPKIVKHQVITKETAANLTNILIKVIDQGTGSLAKIKGYSIAGKTGTAQKPNLQTGGYLKGQYMASFIGFLPATKPKVLILVILDSPRTSIYGGTTSAPIFKKIALKIIDYYNIQPDRPKEDTPISSINLLD